MESHQGKKPMEVDCERQEKAEKKKKGEKHLRSRTKKSRAKKQGEERRVKYSTSGCARGERSA